jgi:hypothetical protein
MAHALLTPRMQFVSKVLEHMLQRWRPRLYLFSFWLAGLAGWKEAGIHTLFVQYTYIWK